MGLEIHHRWHNLGGVSTKLKHSRKCGRGAEVWAEAFKRAIPHVFDTLSEIESISYHTNATRFSHVPILCSEKKWNLLPPLSLLDSPSMGAIIPTYKFRNIAIFFFHLTWLWGGRVGVMLGLCGGLWSSFYVVKPHLWDEFNKDQEEAGAGFYPFYLLFTLLEIQNWKRKYIDWVSEHNNFVIGRGGGRAWTEFSSIPSF